MASSMRGKTEHTMLGYEAPIFRHLWHPVACEKDIAEDPVAIELLGIPLVLARLGMEIVCFYDRCVHRGMPLSAGRVRGDLLQCGYHGYMFASDGSCANIPGLDRASIPVGAYLRKPHGIEVRYGLVWLTLDEPIRPIPMLPDFDNPDFHCDIAGPMRWAADAATVLDNFLDLVISDSCMPRRSDRLAVLPRRQRSRWETWIFRSSPSMSGEKRPLER